MSVFTENLLVGKLRDLKPSQQSVQTLSLWLIHHRKHHAAIVKTWYKELLKSKETKQLTLIYLANDVIQTSKKKGPEYGRTFGRVLIHVFKHLAKTEIQAKTKNSILRVLSIWKKRGVYGAHRIQDYREAIDPTVAGSKRRSVDVDVEEPEMQVEVEVKEPEEGLKVETEERLKIETEEQVEVEEQIEHSPKTPPDDSSEPEKLIKAPLEQDAYALCNENKAVQERVTSLPQKSPKIN